MIECFVFSLSILHVWKGCFSVLDDYLRDVCGEFEKGGASEKIVDSVMKRLCSNIWLRVLREM